MWRKTDGRQHLALLCSLIFSLLPVLALADDGMLRGSLGRWLDTEAAPELAELLSKHPKFRGEPVHVVAFSGGRPAKTPSRLHQAVQTHLTQRLLQYPGVTLAWQTPQQHCGAPRTPSYLLGIEFSAATGASQSLTIAMIDTDESVWVSGISLNWRGRLSSAETMALRTPVPGSPRGTIDSPLPLQATAEISSLLQQNLRCSLPEGVDGPVYLEPAPSRDLSRLRGALQRDLTLAALAAVTPDPADARWRMAVTAVPIGPSTQEIVLTLTDQDGAMQQQLASVFVTPPGNGTTLPADAEIAVTPPGPGAITAAPPLLTEMRLQPYASGGICDTHRSNPGPCVEVSFDLTREAYLFVLSTNERGLHSSNCQSQARRTEPGERRFRLRLAPGDSPDTADAGVYAIAVADRSAARALAKHIGRAPGACSGHSDRGLERWLSQLDELLMKYPGRYEWRAMHLANSNDQPVEI